MARTRRKRDLRVSLLKRKYLKLKSEAEKREKQRAKNIEVEIITGPLLPKRQMPPRIRDYPAVTKTITKRKVSTYTKIAIRIVRRLQRLCYGIRNFVGLVKEPLIWNDDDEDEADGNE